MTRRLSRAWSVLVVFCLAAVGFSAAASKPSAPPPEVIAWVRAQAVPFTTVEAGNGFEDLAPLRALIGDARIVALGETTHGSREVFQMKHRLVEYLATELGFTIFAIEANLPEARRVNDYVAEGRGDPAELIRGMGFWTWSTEEVRAMVEWMRRFNLDPANRRAGRHVEFTGFDMQLPHVPAEVVRDYVAREDAEFLPTVDEAIRCLGPAPGAKPASAVGSLPLERVRGHRVVVSGWIKTEAVTEGWAGLILSYRTADRSAPVFWNNMSPGTPRGTTPWKRYQLEVDVPADAVWTNFGMILQGRGKAWFDDLVVTIDGTPFVPGAEFDFGFERETLRGFAEQPQAGYRVQLAPEAHGGRQSLCISSADTGEETLSRARKLWRECEARLRGAKVKTASAADANAAEWAAQNARVVNQSLAAKDKSQRRDASMADNVEWLLAQNPRAKIVLWAHNGHIARKADAMGGFLGKRHREDMCVLGFATGEGAYCAFGPKEERLAEFPLQSPPPGSVEGVFAATGLPRFALDLRPARQGAGVAGWFNGKRLHRLIGSSEMTEQFEPREVARDYDAIVWIAKTSPSVLLPAKQ